LFKEFDYFLAEIGERDRINTQLAALFNGLPDHVAELQAAFDLGRQMGEKRRHLPAAPISEVAEAFESGRKFKKFLDTSVADFCEKAGDTPRNRRKAAGLFWKFIKLTLPVATVRLQVRIFNRFGEAPYLDKFMRVFGIGEISMLVVCSDEVVQMAKDAKFRDPDTFTREALRELIQRFHKDVPQRADHPED
jgi:hypothetical protein